MAGQSKICTAVTFMSRQLSQFMYVFFVSLSLFIPLMASSKPGYGLSCSTSLDIALVLNWNRVFVNFVFGHGNSAWKCDASAVDISMIHTSFFKIENTEIDRNWRIAFVGFIRRNISWIRFLWYASLYIHSIKLNPWIRFLPYPSSSIFTL